MSTKIKNLIMSATALILCCAILLITNYSLSTNTGEASVQQETVSASKVSVSGDSESAADGKEEVIYIGMDASGAVTDINVVNIFNGGGDITDYGEYTSVKMMTTNDEITLSGDTVTFSTESERVYYQGTLDADTALPWVISIKYYMNGTEYTADEIAGMSGSLKIELSVTENEAYEGECDFAGTYLLQASLTLDTASAENIEAEGATIANVGSDKQLSYMVLPTQELTAEITADVTDFEMPSVEINGVPLSLALDIDSDELEEKIDEMLSGIEELNDGATQIDDGTSTLSDGAQDLDSGVDTLYSGMKTLQSGLDTLNANSDELTEGSEQILAALETIESSLSAINAQTDELSALADASEQIQDGIDSLYSGILSLQTNLSYSNYKLVMAAYGLDIDELVDGNSAAISVISELLSVLKTFRSYLPEGMEDAINKYLSNQGIEDDIFDTLENTATSLVTLLTGNNYAISGMEAYLDEVSAGVDTISEGAAALSESYEEFNEAISSLTSSLSLLLSQMVILRSGVETLVDSYETLDSGLNEYTDGVAEVVAGYSQLVSGMYTLSSGSSELVEGVSELAEGTSELSDGTQELYDEVNDAYDEAKEELSGLIDAITGESEIYSFVSDKNENVSSVQFVITTEAIEIEAEETEEVSEEEELTLWDRIKALFTD